MNTVTNLILNTEAFPFFDIVIFLINDIWEQYFLAFLRISSILDFSNFKAPEMRVMNLEKDKMNWVAKLFLAP